GGPREGLPAHRQLQGVRRAGGLPPPHAPGGREATGPHPPAERRRNQRGGTMKDRRLGNTGLKVSEVSLGAWTTFGHTVEEQQTVTRIMEKAYELGINFFDNADVYHRGAGERTMGAALKELAFPRQSYVLSSKVFNKMSEAPTDRGLSRKHVLESIDM